MSEWRGYKLSEILATVKNQYIPAKGDNLPYIGLEHIQQESLRLDGIGNSDNVTSQKYKFTQVDVLFGKLRPYFRKVVSVNFEGVCSTDIWVLRAKRGHSQKFIKYLVASTEFIETCNIGESGTRMPRADWNYLKDTIWLVPEFYEQERIAEVLSSLDDKIDLLQRQNKTLEEMAETLFRQWFENVEKDESSQIMNIEDVATVQNGYSFKSSDFVSEQIDTIEVLKMGHISAEGGLRQSPKKDFVKRNEKYSKWILNKRDIILAMTDMKDNVVILGVPALIDHDNKYVLNQRVGRIFLKENSAINSILILFMQMKEKNFISELQSKGNSGVQVNLGTDTIRQTKIVVPAKKIQKEILPQLESIFDKLDQNRKHTHQLETLRDTLLPKLMSGDVRVN